MRTLVLALAVVLLAACANTTYQSKVIASCEIYAATLTSLAVLRAEGKLSVNDAALIDSARSVANPICYADTIPGDGNSLALVEAALSNLTYVKTRAEN